MREEEPRFYHSRPKGGEASLSKSRKKELEQERSGELLSFPIEKTKEQNAESLQRRYIAWPR